ncbi:MAG: radical SAM protein [Desulfovibrio sp.]|jgi:uncharacterized radical SAM superfamily Fe-S cluster-containing enzyme|nr:radical SAM protein [Desulfovibrio sp.]
MKTRSLANAPEARLPIPERQSLCPVCLKTLPAELVRREDSVFLLRTCPEHGEFSGLLWKGEPGFDAWARPRNTPPRLPAATAADKGCPRDCGPCPEHRQTACTVLFEITRRCNLNCPVCFASSGGEQADGLKVEDLGQRLHRIRALAGEVVLQFSGGEPTLHPGLPEMIRLARSLFPAVQLNTNGVLLGRDADLARILADSGLSWVFLQFDGTTDDIHMKLRGRPLLDVKLEAVRRCREAGLPVVLVPTLAAGVNDKDLGNLLRLGLSLAPTVRGLHLQPMTLSGRNLPGRENPDSYLTLPETLQAVCAQSDGLVRPEHAFAPCCEHERCSFHFRYRKTPSGKLIPLRGPEGECCSPHSGLDACCSPAGEGGRAEGGSLADPAGADGARRAVEAVRRAWEAGEAAGGGDAFDAFIAKARSEIFSITCMAFQDCRNVELERLRGCCVFVYVHPDRLVPFCAYNMTSLDGTPLHRHV